MASACPSKTSSPSATSMRTTRPGIGQSRNFEVSGGAFSGISAASSAMPRRQHGDRAGPPRGARMRSPPGDRLHLAAPAARRRPRAAPAALAGRPVRGHAHLAPVREAARSLPRAVGVDRHRPGRAVCSVTTQSLPTLRSWLSIAPGDPRPPDLAHPVHRRRRAATRCSVSGGSSAPWKPSGYSSAMKPVVIAPSTKRGWSITADQERQVVADPLDLEAVERRRASPRSPSAGPAPRCRAWRSSGRSTSRSRRPRRRRCRCAPRGARCGASSGGR